MAKPDLKQLLADYYTDLYRDQLGLADYRWRVQQRLKEDNPSSYYNVGKNLDQLTKLINYSFKNKKVLVIGVGTGVGLVQLQRRGCQVYGIDPDRKALEILKTKAVKEKIPLQNIIRGVGEKLPFKDGWFDFVYAWQVLEHVQNVAQVIKEMHRVTKKGGYIFIGCPDYRQIVEVHYKLYLPLFLPKWLVKIILLIRGRKINYFNHLQYVNAAIIKRLLRKYPLTSMQIIKPYSAKEQKPEGLNKFKYWLQDYLGIEQTQWWLAKKN